MALEKHPPPLETQRLELEPLGPQHAAALFAALADPEGYRFVPGDPPADANVLEARYRRTAAGPNAASERWYNWAVLTREPHAAIGTVEVTIRDDGAYAFLAYALDKRAWGRGYAREACGAVLDYLRGATPVRSVVAEIDTRNARSIALVERLGFVKQATIVNADYFKGSRSDEYRYALEFVKDDRGETEQR